VIRPALLRVTPGEAVGEAGRWVSFDALDGHHMLVFELADLYGDLLRVEVQGVDRDDPGLVMIRLPPSGRNPQKYAIVPASSVVEDTWPWTWVGVVILAAAVTLSALLIVVAARRL
jgi:hypothetical protein